MTNVEAVYGNKMKDILSEIDSMLTSIETLGWQNDQAVINWLDELNKRSVKF